MAKQTLVSTAVKQGVEWKEYVTQKEAELQELEAIKAELEDMSIQYPSYYLVPFHAYDKGNLDWLPAFEVEPATYVMALRTFKDQQLSPQEAYDKLRAGITDNLKSFISQHKLATPRTIVDVGCSVGCSTRWLYDQFPEAQVQGLDLSPYFLAVAEQYERQRPAGARRILYRHGMAEATGMQGRSVDLLSYQFVAHECPGEVLDSFIKEARRIVKPGGIVMFADNNPRSKTIQNLPPALFTLMKSTEPHSDSYYSYDLEAGLRQAGFKEVITCEADHRHRCVLALAP